VEMWKARTADTSVLKIRINFLHTSLNLQSCTIITKIIQPLFF